MREYLGAIVGFQLPVLSDPGSTLTVWPQCTSFYEGDLGGVVGAHARCSDAIVAETFTV